MDLRCELCKNKCCIYLPGVPQTERKGRKDRRESARRTGLRILGLVQKTGMVNVHLVVHKLTFWLNGKSVNNPVKAVGSIPANVAKPKSVRLQEENQLIVLQNEHAARPQADL